MADLVPARWGRAQAGNVVVPGRGPLDMVNVSGPLSRGAVVWKDLRWIREAWPEPMIVKGVLIADDARRWADEGASAVVVLNHGGRQLASVSPTIRALPEIVAAVGTRSKCFKSSGLVLKETKASVYSRRRIVQTYFSCSRRFE
jgi:L-lactate dehydrogenase (cytochrome)